MITGSWSGEAKIAADKLREQVGLKVGVVRVRYIRPWPEERLRETLANARGVVVFDRAISFGSKGQLFTDLAATLYDSKVSMRGVIAGLGGVDVPAEDMMPVVKEFADRVEESGFVYEPVYWLLPPKYRGRVGPRAQPASGG